MKYNQPYGISDPNGPYINGNPSTGTMGSIPPAASIEYPQREIVAAINAARKQDLSGPQFNPDNADLAQLARAVQSSLINTARDTGTANAYACTLSPAPAALFEGQEVTLKIANANTGASVFNLNSLGNKPIVNPFNSSALNAGALSVGAYVKLKYDGTNWQMVWSTGAGGAVYLTAPRTFYVNGTTGSDSYDGTLAAFTSSGHGPFATIQKAANQLPLYNLNGYDVTITVADGNYTQANFPTVNGSGTVRVLGNRPTPSNCTVTAPATQGGIGFGFGAGAFYVAGFRFSASAAGNVDCISCSGGSCNMQLGTNKFGPAARYHIFAQSAATIYMDSAVANIITIEAGANAAAHIGLVGGSVLGTAIPAGPGGWPALTILGAASFSSGFINCYANAYCSGALYSSISGAASVTGPKFNVSLNGVIATNGGGVNYYPGSTAGVQATGGQYV